MSCKFLILSILLSGIVLSSSGCVRVDKGNTQSTFGDQLRHLVGARECGFISNDEFRKLRGNLIRKFGR
jgi:hypothetical protein